jgi:AraC family transcriptional regulator, regulatory protein of adaptative response / methylated-DNA-[protein]-cysteine methyltransferase
MEAEPEHADKESGRNDEPPPIGLPRACPWSNRWILHARQSDSSSSSALARIGFDRPMASDFSYRLPRTSPNFTDMIGPLPPGLDWETCDRARLARDPAFDGLFFTGVRTTRIYCRPVCPVRPAKSKNVRFFAAAAAAERAGFRPCLRCRPETAPGSPAWAGTATTVVRGMRLIEEGFLDEASVAALADRLGIGSRHLLRLFLRHTGATPSEIAATRRIQVAKRMIDQTAMPLSEIAFASGFRSVRRFNEVFRATYGRPPSSFREKPSGVEPASALYRA